MSGPETGEIRLQRSLTQWRPVENDDTEVLHRLISRIEVYDNPPYRTTLGEVRSWLSSDTEYAGRLGFLTDDEGNPEVICFALVSKDEEEHSYIARGGVAPGYRGRGVGAAVVQWQIEQGTALLEEYSQGKGRIITQVAGDQEELQQHLCRLGFTWSRSSYELRRSLEDPLEIPELGRYYSLEPWGEDWNRQAERVYAKLTANQQSRAAVSEEWMSGLDHFRPEWSFVVVNRRGDRPVVVGFIRVSAYPADWEALGWKEGYIDLLGVDDIESASTLSLALVAASMRAQKADGMDKVATGVGVASNAGAAGFYEKIGFERSFQTRTYTYSL